MQRRSEQRGETPLERAVQAALAEVRGASGEVVQQHASMGAHLDAPEAGGPQHPGERLGAKEPNVRVTPGLLAAELVAQRVPAAGQEVQALPPVERVRR